MQNSKFKIKNFEFQIQNPNFKSESQKSKVKIQIQTAIWSWDVVKMIDKDEKAASGEDFGRFPINIHFVSDRIGGGDPPERIQEGFNRKLVENWNEKKERGERPERILVVSPIRFFFKRLKWR